MGPLERERVEAQSAPSELRNLAHASGEPKCALGIDHALLGGEGALVSINDW